MIVFDDFISKLGIRSISGFFAIGYQAGELIAQKNLRTSA
jgi:hypothetical protein